MKSLQSLHISAEWDPFSRVVGFSVEMTLFKGVNWFFFSNSVHLKFSFRDVSLFPQSVTETPSYLTGKASV